MAYCSVVTPEGKLRPRALPNYFGCNDLVIVGTREMKYHAECLEETPAYGRRIFNLFISTYDERDEDCPPDVHPLSRMLPGVNNTCLSSSQSPEDQAEVYETYLRILRAVAPTLRRLCVLLSFSRPSIFVPVDLPELKELCLHGPVDYAYKWEERTAPSLRHLHLDGLFANPEFLYARIKAYAPDLTHLIQVVPKAYEGFHTDLIAALPWKPAVAVTPNVRVSPTKMKNIFSRVMAVITSNIVPRKQKVTNKRGPVTRSAILPWTVRRVGIGFGPDPLDEDGGTPEKYVEMCCTLQAMAEEDHRIVVAKMPIEYSSSFEDAKERWVLRMEMNR